MINSRKIEDLLPAVQTKCRLFLAECEKLDVDILITSTFRDNESQNALFAQGRTRQGKIVTNARGGQSFHNWCVAFDVVPLLHGKPDWDNMLLWDSIGHIGKACGLEWGGDWKSVDMPHFQFTGGLTLRDLQNGKTI